MPPGWNSIRALLVAAAFTPAELEVLCQAVFGSSLAGITTSTDADEMAEAIVAFAIRYDMVRELTDMVLHESARRPAVQNLLLSDGMAVDSTTAELQRLALRVDRLSEQMQQVLAELAAVRQWQATADARLHGIEANLPVRRQPEGLSTLDRALVVLMALAVLAVLAVGVYFGAVQP